MKLSGHLTLQIIDELTGEIVQTIEQDNIITNMAYSDPSLINSCYWQGRNIFISNETAQPVRTKTSIQCLGAAYQGAGQPPMQPFHNANPPYFVITQTLDALATSRTFQTVGLTPDNPGQNVNTTVRPWAYLLLNAPCVQEPNQILVLTYRVTIQDSGSGNIQKVTHPRWLNLICYNLVYNNAIYDYDHHLFNTVADAPLKEYGWTVLANTNVLGPMIGENYRFGSAVSWQGDQASLFFRRKLYWDFYRSNFAGQYGANGRLINSILCGWNVSYNTQAPEPDPYVTKSAWTSAQTQFATNLQSAFAYNAAPPDDRGPMFLASNNPTGTGVLSFSEDPWTGTWPTAYRIKITESGGVGTAKYVLGVRHYTGFSSDSNFTYPNCTRSFHPYVVALIQPYNKCHGWQFASPIIAIDDKFTVQYDRTGLSIIHQFTGQHFDFDATTTPSLPITNARQIAIDAPRNLLYIACSNTGLWKLDITNKSAAVITNVSTTPTYAVDVDKDGIVYAFMNLSSTVVSLTSSASNYVTNLGFTTIGLSTSDWINIHINKIHPDTRIAVVVRIASSYLNLRDAKVYWWSLGNGNSTTNYTGILYCCGETQTSCAWVNGSSNKFWTSYDQLLTFNVAAGTTFSAINPYNIEEIVSSSQIVPEAFIKLDGTSLPRPSTSYMPPLINQDIWGNLHMIRGQRVHRPSDGLNIGTYNESTYGNGKTVTLTNGICLTNTARYHLFNNGMNNDINKWIWYKWNGTSWVRSITHDPDTYTWTDTTGTATKLTSTTSESLLDGIKVRFTNGTTEPSFVAGEVYDQYVGKGILKTNDNYVYIDHCTFYTQPVFTKVPLTSTTISAGNNHGVVLDGAPGNTGLSPATSAIAVNSLWHSTIPEYVSDNMFFSINNIPVTRVFAETIDTIPLQNTLTTGQIIVYRNGLVLCSAADVGKTLSGYFSYVAKSD